MSYLVGTMAAVKRTGRPSVVLALSERELLVRDLEEVLRRATVVEDVLTVSAWRSGTNPSEWTDLRLARLREAAGELLEAVRKARVGSD